MEKSKEKEFEEKIEKKVESWADSCGKGKKSKKDHFNGGVGGAIYGLGFIGAAIYYIGHADSFWVGVLGFLKALVWPTFVVYHLLEFLYK